MVVSWTSSQYRCRAGIYEINMDKTKASIELLPVELTNLRWVLQRSEVKN
jgi:hypothetical protein